MSEVKAYSSRYSNYASQFQRLVVAGIAIG